MVSYSLKMAANPLPLVLDSGTITPPQVLIFSRTCGYRHASIEAAATKIKLLGTAAGLFYSMATDHASVVDPGHPFSLSARFRVVVLLQTSGDFLTRRQLASLREFVHNGGGVVAIHCASTGFPPSEEADKKDENRKWYRDDLIGATFTEHPAPQDGRVVAEDPKHPILAWGGGDALAAFDRIGEGQGGGQGGELEWKFHDEWYNFSSNPREKKGVKVLLRVDEGSYEGGRLGADHPIAWCREGVDGDEEGGKKGGRSFYTALGHFEAAYEDETLMAQLRNAILWAARVI